MTTGFDGTARVSRAADGAELRAIEVSGKLRGVRGSLAPGGVLVTMTSDGRGTAWELATGRAIGAIDHGAPIVGANLSADGTLSVTCGADRTARIWDIRERRLVRELTGHAGAVLTCELSPGGDRLLTTSQDGTAKLWELATGRVVAAVQAGGIVADGQFSPDGRRFTTVNLDGTLRLWSADAGALIASVDDPGGSVLHAFAGDRTLFAARRDRDDPGARPPAARGCAMPSPRRPARPPVPAPTPSPSLSSARASMAPASPRAAATRSRCGTPRPAARSPIAPPASARPIRGRSSIHRSAPPAPPPPPASRSPPAPTRPPSATPPTAACSRSCPSLASRPRSPRAASTPLVGHAWLVPDGSAAVVLSSGVTVWELPVEPRGPAEVRALVRSRVPWRVGDGRLLAAGGELAVRVTRRGAPVSEAAVIARPLPDTIDGSVVMPPAERRYEARTGGAGALPPRPARRPLRARGLGHPPPGPHALPMAQRSFSSCPELASQRLAACDAVAESAITSHEADMLYCGNTVPGNSLLLLAQLWRLRLTSSEERPACASVRCSAANLDSELVLARTTALVRPAVPNRTSSGPCFPRGTIPRSGSCAARQHRRLPGRPRPSWRCINRATRPRSSAHDR